MAIEKFKSNIEDYLHLSTEPGDKGTKIQDWQDYQRNVNATIQNIIGADILWQPNTSFAVDNVVRSPNMVAGTYARVTKAGTTAASEPVWTGVGTTVTDGTVTYIMLPRTIDFATQAEVTAGTVKDKIVTPASMQALITAIYAKAKLDAHPVGSIYESTIAESPASLFGGTWEEMEAGLVLVSQGTAKSGTVFTAGDTGGEEKHTLTTGELPAHTHAGTTSTASLTGTLYTSSNGGASGIASSTEINKKGALNDSDPYCQININASHSHTFITNATGGGSAHNIMQPYLTVYRWKRTA